MIGVSRTGKGEEKQELEILGGRNHTSAHSSSSILVLITIGTRRHGGGASELSLLHPKECTLSIPATARVGGLLSRSLSLSLKRQSPMY